MQNTQEDFPTMENLIHLAILPYCMHILVAALYLVDHHDHHVYLGVCIVVEVCHHRGVFSPLTGAQCHSGDHLSCSVEVVQSCPHTVGHTSHMYLHI